MTQPAGIDLQLNANQYLQSSVSVLQQTGAMEQSLTRLAVATNVLNRSLDGASFSKKHSAALGTFAAAAAVSQQQLSGLSATAAVTGQSAAKLGNGIRTLARDFPTGTQTALDTVSAINQLGIATQGSEKKVLSLSKTMIQLQGAAGGYAADYAPGMLQLERTFGDQGVDPKKVQATADALVSVSKHAGASVQGTLAFSNAIGPVAQSAGIGKLATLGIGAAMNSIGQDGTRAATAVNRMLTDMSSAVRDGGPQMNTYADIVGMTAENFKKMYKNNPAAAIEEVTTAIGKAGQQGPRILQNLGLDGVTTFRSLQALSASGTLTNAINTSIAAGSGGGNGATAKASSAAFGGVLDKFSEVSTSAGQVATALGRPMLGALGLFASALSGVTKRVAGAMDNRWVKDAINVAGGLLVARRVFGLGLTGAMARQGLTSGPAMSLLAGYRTGMGQTLNDGRLGGRFGRAAGGIQEAEQQGVLRTGAMGGIRGRLYDFGAGWGQSRAASQARAATERIAQEEGYLRRTHGMFSPQYQAFQASQAAGPAPIEQAPLWTRIRRVGVTAARAYANVNDATFRAATTPAMEREAVISNALRTTGGTTSRMFGAMGGVIASPFRSGASFSDELTKAKDAAHTWGKEVTGASGTARSFGRSMASLAASTGNFGLRSAGGAAMGTLRAGAGMLRGIGGMLMSPTGLMMGGLALGGFLHNRQQQASEAAKAESERTANMTPTGQLDKYNESLGRAAQSTQTFSQSMDSNAKLVNTAVINFKDALRVSPADISGAAGGKNVVTYNSGSTNAELKAQISQTSVGGMDPQQYQVVKGDLIRQFGARRAQQVLSGLPQRPTTAQVAAGGAGNQLATMATNAASVAVNAPVGLTNFPLEGKYNQVSPDKYYGWGTSTDKITLKQPAKDINDTAVQAVQQRFQQQANAYGKNYAAQTASGDINQVMMAVAQFGNEAETNALGDSYIQNVFGLAAKDIPRITSSDITKYHSFTAAAAAKSPKVASWLKSRGLTPEGTGGYQAIPQLNELAQRFKSPSVGAKGPSPLLQFFDNTMTSTTMGSGSTSALGRSGLSGRETRAGLDALAGQATPSKAVFGANQTMQSSVLLPDDRQLATKAVNQTTSAALNSGMSFKQLGDSISQAASMIDDSANPAFQRLIGMLGRLGDVAQAAAPFQSSGANNAALGTLATANINVTGTSDEAVAARQTGKEQGQQFEQAYASQVKNQLMAERQYQIQSTRGQYDYQVQSFNAYLDYLHQKEVAERDYNIQTQRAGDDYRHTRLIAERDFNKQIKREVQDAAQGLYDPYKRVQTQATWDVQSLLANMAEQNQKVVKQNQQLAELRKQGLSEQTIEQLKLNDPANAQQLNQISGDAKNKPSEIAQLNAASAISIKNASALVNDQSNKPLTRAKEDFANQLGDMKYTFDTAAKRAKEDIQRSTGDMAYAYGVMMSRAATAYQTALFRMRADTNEAESEMVLSTTQMWSAAQDLIAGKYVDTSQYMQNSLGTTVQWIKDNNLGDAIANSIGMSKNFGGMTITITGSPNVSPPTSDGTGSGGATAAGSQSGTAGGNKPKAAPSNPTGDPRWNSGTAGAGGRTSGDGGIFTSPQLRYIGERGAEAVLPLSGQGISMLAEAFSRAQISHTQLNRMNTAGHRTPVQYVQHTEHHIVDQSTNYAGANFTVQAQDPDLMQRKLEAKKRASNLVPSGKRQHS